MKKKELRREIKFYKELAVELTSYMTELQDKLNIANNTVAKKIYHYCIYEYINNKDKSFVISQPWNDLEKLKARYESSNKIKVLEYRTISIKE